MTSVSLPRSLGRRSMGLEAEREEFLRNQAAAVAKAVNTQEAAAKQKHIRTIIIGTHREKGAGTFWNNINRLTLEHNVVLSWKFCHVLHKIMRDGHPRVVADSMKYRGKLEDLGRLWGHLRNGYGSLIKLYCKLLMTKLEFHRLNPRIPGSLVMTDEELEAVGEKDVNNWFELTIEMLDYLDETLNLQAAVFNSLDMSRAASSTTSGQCRLAPLILAVLDSSCLYDYIVKMMFKLHAALPPDTLVGHRDRFNGLFKTLKQFYYTSSNLQYFKYLVSIPPLPENPPNFLVASDFDNYVTPKVLLHDQMSEAGMDTPPDSRSVVDLPLVDVSEPTPSVPPPATHNELAEKDQLIHILRQDLEDNKVTLYRLQEQYQSSGEHLQRRILQLEQELQTTKSILDQLTEENERYRTQADQLQNEKNHHVAVQLEESEKKAQSSEEKFKKMKEVYAKLRDEHIDVLKKLTTIQKELDALRISSNEWKASHDSSIMELESLRQERTLAQERLLHSSDEAKTYSSQIAGLQAEIAKSQADYQKRVSEFETKLSVTENQLSAAKERCQTLTKDVATLRDILSLLFQQHCEECVLMLAGALDQFENPAHLSVTSTPEYVLTRTPTLFEQFEKMKQSTLLLLTDDREENAANLIPVMSFCCHLLCEVILYGKATSNAAPSNRIENLVNVCRDTLTQAKQLFTTLKKPEDRTETRALLSRTNEHLERFENEIRTLLTCMADVDRDALDQLVDKEMKMMDNAILLAAEKIQAILAKSREDHTGVKLEVHEKILDACTTLMRAIMELVRKAKALQEEIVHQGRGTGSVKEFYKRNHQWTEGLLSAAKAVGVGAQVLVEAADRTVSGNGKFEELIAASQEIAASVAQLVISSKVKADRESQRLAAVGSASKSVTQATAAVLGTVKSGQEILYERESLDFTHLSLHQAKRAEMESQVRVLELENELEKERLKLAELRKRHYQLAGPSEGWDEQK